MKPIYHFIEKEIFDSIRNEKEYRPASLEEEGFIHCTGEPELVLRVADYMISKDPKEFYLLEIDEDLLIPEVKNESYTGGKPFFPHVYGPLNMDALTGVEDFNRRDDGTFIFPEKYLRTTLTL